MPQSLRWQSLSGSSREQFTLFTFSRAFSRAFSQSQVCFVACFVRNNEPGYMGNHITICVTTVRREHWWDRMCDGKDKAVAAMKAHNADETQAYQQGISQFSDLTLEQFQALPIRDYMASSKVGLTKVWYTSLRSGWMIALSRIVAATMVSWITREQGHFLRVLVPIQCP